MFLTDWSQHALQSLHSFDWSGAGQVLPAPDTTVDVLAQLPEAGWSIIGIENRKVKLSGTALKYLLVHASRVGSQWLVSGVSLATANIFNKCSSSWTSPESCHLKYLDFLELINSAIAPTHSGDRIAASLLY
jgi:hypothetical protein